jgi:hypothetical protein
MSSEIDEQLYITWRSRAVGDPEIDAISSCMIVLNLRNLDAEQKKRVVKYLVERFCKENDSTIPANI